MRVPPQPVSLAGALLVLALHPTAQKAELEAEFLRRRADQRIEVGIRRLELGLECRRKGLEVLGAREIHRAVQLSEGRHLPAREALDEIAAESASASRRGKPPSAGKIEGVHTKVQRLRRRDQEEQYELARWAEKKELFPQAEREFLDLLAGLEGPLESDARGRILTPAGRIPLRVSEPVLARAVPIGGRPYLRTERLDWIGADVEVFEHAGEHLRVRGLRDREEVERMHALCSQLLEPLTLRLEGRPARVPTLFLFPDLTSYRSAAAAAGLAPPEGVQGIADLGGDTALVCSADLEPELVLGLALHELTHVVAQGVSPSVLPSWFGEGLAESWGGQGTFAVADGRLAFGGPMSPHRLAPLVDPSTPFSLAELVTTDVLTLWAEDPAAARTFYARSWAALRFLESEAEPAITSRFGSWVHGCRAGALGAADGSPVAAQEHFVALFEEDLPALEAPFRAWLLRLQQDAARSVVGEDRDPRMPGSGAKR